jgi:hypothetical protein
VQWVLAVVALIRGDYASGWREAEWRWKCKDFSSPKRQWSKPQWKGEQLNGETILLHAEQGFGDTVQFVRYAPMVAERGGKVILECPAVLHRLLKNLPGIAGIVPETAQPEFDLQCPLLSLPLAFGTLLDTVPNRVPYLTPEPQLCEQWGKLIGERASGLKVGLTWAGSPTHQNDRKRSLTLNQLLPLAQAAGVTFFSLQKGPAAQQANDPAIGFPIADLTARLTDFADTAAMISQLDLVITVDTVIAHLAGALGKPVWVFLPRVPDWRWMLDREDTPWYPTMRLFRQEVHGQWEKPIRRAAGCLMTRSI